MRLAAMRVVDVSSFFTPGGGGGIATYYREKARWLPRAGVDCHFVVPGRRRATRRFGGGVLHEVPGLPIPGGAPYRVFADLGHLTRLVAELEPDVVELASHYVLPDLVARAWSGRARPALVGFYHSDYPDTYIAPALGRAPCTLREAALGAAWAWVRRQHARYDATLTGSRQVAAKLAERGVARVAWVGLGIDPDRFRPAGGEREPGPPRLLYVGRLAREKGYPTLLAAMPEIHRRTGAVLDVIGIGRLSGGRGAPPDLPAGAVRELGRATEVEVAHHMARVDALVAPGPFESFSLAAAEAMACGLPVVGADRGGNAELVGASGAGVLFAHDDPAALCEAVCGLLSLSPEDLRGLGRRGRDHATAALTWAQVFGRIHYCYRELLA